MALILETVPGPIEAVTNDPSTPTEDRKQTDQDRCKFLMENVNATILSLNADGEITFLNRYGQRFFGYSSEEILGKPMLGTLTPLTGFQGRDLTTFVAGVVHHPNRYAFSVNANMLRDGRRVQTFWSNKGISDNQGNVREVLRVGLDITNRKLRLQALAQELRTIGQMLNGGTGSKGANLRKSQAASRRSPRSWKGHGGKAIPGNMRA